MALAFDARQAREALAALPDLAAQESLEPPELAGVYVPPLHAKALHLDASVVVGMRGAGKSLWTAVLASPKHREFVAAQLPGSALSRVTVAVGFGLDETESSFPRTGTVKSLLDDGCDSYAIWLAVILRHARQASGQPEPEWGGAWRGRVRWVLEHGEEAHAQITAADEALSRRGQVLLVVFDALDRLSIDWDRVRKLSSAALQLGLQLRSRRALRLKFFIRPEFEEDGEIWRFPDSSKLRHAKVDLTWSSTDLYGLIFMRLGNASGAGRFASEFRRATVSEAEPWAEREGVFVPPPILRRDPKVQQPIVEALADRYMGGGPKRGLTYLWVPLHLADAAGRISPRSYLLAFKAGAEHTARERPEHPRALRYDAIQAGVVRASEIRVREIAEDYPWVTPLLEAARGSVVPISAEELAGQWTSARLEEMLTAAKGELPPRRFSSDPIRRNRSDALLEDLVELGVLYRTKDGRLNMPDIFRVGFGIRRRGGVKPPR